MSSPMYEIPEHFPMEVDEDGQGPVDPQDAAATICWTCGTLWPCRASVKVESLDQSKEDLA